MIYVNIRQTVTDFAKWHAGFEAHRAARRSAGATGKIQIFQDVEDPNTVSLILEWDNAENAHRFMTDPTQHEIMQNAGVVGTSAISAIQSRVKLHTTITA